MRYIAISIIFVISKTMHRSIATKVVIRLHINNKDYTIMTQQEMIKERASIAAMSEQEACDKYNVDFKHEVLKMLDEEIELTPEEEVEEQPISMHKEIFGRYTAYGYGC